MDNMNVQGEKPATFFTEIELTDEQLESIFGGFGRYDEPHHQPGNEQHQEPREEGWYDEHHRWHQGQRHGYWNGRHQWVWDNY